MKASHKFLAASAITAAFTWSTLTQAFSQTASNDKDVAFAKTATYKTPASPSDGDTSKSKPTGENSGHSPIEIVNGSGVDAQDRSFDDKILTIYLNWGNEAKYTAQQVAELFGKELQTKHGLKPEEFAVYVNKSPGKHGIIAAFLPPGAPFIEMVKRDGKFDKTSSFTANEAYERLGLIAETYNTAKYTLAKKTSVSATYEIP